MNDQKESVEALLLSFYQSYETFFKVKRKQKRKYRKKKKERKNSIKKQKFAAFISFRND